MRRGHPGLWLALLALASLACSLTIPDSTPTLQQPPVTVAPTPAPTAVSPPSPTPIPDTGWRQVSPGIEIRTLRLMGKSDQLVEVMSLVRVDPGGYRFEVLYAPGQPRTVRDWATGSGAVVTLNAGYFTPEFEATGLLIAGGTPYGTSYGAFAGMLAVGSFGVELRWLAEQPYQAAEPLQEAVQSFPVLIRPGGVLGYEQEDGMPSRRTAIGQDSAGRMVIIVCPRGGLTLHQLANTLLVSDLDLQIALNLDGGTSTGLEVATGEDPVTIPSYAPVPAVITIRPV